MMKSNYIYNKRATLPPAPIGHRGLSQCTIFTFSLVKLQQYHYFTSSPRSNPIMFEHNRLSIIAAQSNDKIQQHLEFKRQHYLQPQSVTKGYHNVSLSHFYLQNCNNIAISLPTPEVINHARMCVRVCVCVEAIARVQTLVCRSVCAQTGVHVCARVKVWACERVCVGIWKRLRVKSVCVEKCFCVRLFFRA